MARDKSANAQLATLDLPPNATLDDVRTAYRDLCMIWHPDRHPPHLKERADEKLKALNSAYTWLKSHPELLAGSQPSFESRPSSSRNPQPVAPAIPFIFQRWKAASDIRRALAWFIDVGIAIAGAFYLERYLKVHFQNPWHTAASFVPSVLYLHVRDALFRGRGFGKLAFGLTVLDARTHLPCGFLQSILRNSTSFGAVTLLFVLGYPLGAMIGKSAACEVTVPMMVVTFVGSYVAMKGNGITQADNIAKTLVVNSRTFKALGAKGLGG